MILKKAKLIDNKKEKRRYAESVTDSEVSSRI
jgi:hypothetical protein